MTFAQLGLSQPILRALAKEGYETPTPIQAQTIPHTLEAKDVLGCAQTGTGKTAAFALPIIQRLMDMPIDKSRRGPAKARALILSPTRELALQIRDSFAVYGKESGLRSTVIFGGVSQFRQVQALRDGVDIIIATPGRLIDLMDQRKAHLDEVKILVLDEADRMLDMGFIQPIRMIASKIPAERQTLLFSATMPPEIKKLADSLLRNPVNITVSHAPSAAPKIEQSLYHVNRMDKQALLTLLLSERSMERVVVFTKTKHGAEKVGRKLHHAGVNAETIHGNKAQNARKKALDLFRAGKARVLVATDVAARGLDVDGITHVINFDLPMEPEAYVHRIGRTGRAGATGIAISFCDGEEKGLLKQIERLIKTKVPTKPLPTFDAIKKELRLSESREFEAREFEAREFEAKPTRDQFRQNRAPGHGGFRSGASQHGNGSSSQRRSSEHDSMDPRDRRKLARANAQTSHTNPNGHASTHASRPRAGGKPTAHTYNTGNVTHTVSYDDPGASSEYAGTPAKRAPHNNTGHTPRKSSGASPSTSRPSHSKASPNSHAPRKSSGNSHGGSQSGGHGGGNRNSFNSRSGKPAGPRRSA